MLITPYSLLISIDHESRFFPMEFLVLSDEGSTKSKELSPACSELPRDKSLGL